MDVVDQLKKLQSLLDAGLLTRDEFEGQKQKLMQMRPGEATPSLTTHGERLMQLGAYHLAGKVGEGGMGTVYRARHTQSGVAARQGGDVAIKVMHAQYTSRPDFRDRFDREAELGLRLDHPNVVNVYDLVVDGTQLALVMEWVEGRPLSKMIGEETGPLPWDRARPVFQQVLDGVEYAHGEGVIHRDLKPDNIMVTPDGKIKILDLGIAKASGEGKTKTGTGLGTVDYMAPEQYLDAKRVDHRADIYALGMTLYEMLAGRLPWEVSTTEFRVLDWKRTGELPPPTEYYPSIPPHVVATVMKAIAVDMDERFPDVGSFRAALQGESAALAPEPSTRATAQRPAQPPPLTEAPKTSRKGPSLGLVVIVMAFMGLGVFGVGVVVVTVSYMGTSVEETFDHVSSAMEEAATESGSQRAEDPHSTSPDDRQTSRPSPSQQPKPKPTTARASPRPQPPPTRPAPPPTPPPEPTPDWRDLHASLFGNQPALQSDLKRRREAMVRSVRSKMGSDLDERVASAMSLIPMELFCPSDQVPLVYSDNAVPIGYSETISSPYVTAYMLSALDVRRGHRVLELKTASGYQTTLLAEMGAHVFSLETDYALGRALSPTLEKLGYDNLYYVVGGDAYAGLPNYAPYDRIIATAAYPEAPWPLLNLLKPGGKLVAPVGQDTQALTLYERTSEGFSKLEFLSVVFSPMPR